MINMVSYHSVAQCGQVVKRAMIDMVLIQNLFVPICYILGKDILRHFSWLGGFGNQFKISIMSLEN